MGTVCTGEEIRRFRWKHRCERMIMVTEAARWDIGKASLPVSLLVS